MQAMERKGSLAMPFAGENEQNFLPLVFFRGCVGRS